MSDDQVGAAGPPAEAAPAQAERGTTLRASEEMIRDALSEVYDPEIGIDVVSLGLVYGVDVDEKGLLTVEMTLTSPFCPLASILESQVHAVCLPLPGSRTSGSTWSGIPPGTRGPWPPTRSSWSWACTEASPTTMTPTSARTEPP